MGGVCYILYNNHLFIFKGIIIFYFSCLVILISLNIWSSYSGYDFSLSSLIFWWIFLGWILASVFMRLGYNGLRYLTFLFFILGATLFTMGLADISETIFRVGFTLWVVVFGKSLLSLFSSGKSYH